MFELTNDSAELQLSKVQQYAVATCPSLFKPNPVFGKMQFIPASCLLIQP